MNQEQWKRIEEIFDRVVDLPPGEQAAALRRECGGDGEILERVRRLLDQDAGGGKRIAEVIEGLARIAKPEDPSFAGRKVGPYRIIREVGRGGMGMVFEAVREDDHFQKRVALKVAVRAAYSSEMLHRFRNERQILAQLEHANIARLLDGGATEEEIPFFVMEYVEGEALDAYAERLGLSLAARLQLFLQVCEAVEYAHQNLVIHRDLKPANILVANDVARLLDFGIAKLTEAGDGTLTSAGMLPGTPDYCSPEQVRGDRVTTRTDVYSLGLVLYKLLTGERGQKADVTSPLTLAETVCEAPVVAPSACAAARGDKTLARQLRGDLDTIVLTAVQKDPARRYASPAALGEDVKRYLDGRPILARQDSTWYQVRMFVRRHWAGMIAAVLVAVSLVAGIVATTYQARRAERRFDQVRRIANTLLGEIQIAIRDLPASAKAQELVVRTAVEYLDGLSREAGDDITLQAEAADGFTEIAKIAYSMERPSLNRPDDARRYYERALAILGDLYRKHPKDARVARSLVTAAYTMGDFCAYRGQPEEALRLLNRAVEVGEESMAASPNDAGLLGALADAYNRRIATFAERTDTSAAVPRHLAVVERLAKMVPETPDSLVQVGLAHSQAGKVAAYAGKNEEAMEHFRRNATILTRVVGMVPENGTARRNLMMGWFHIGDTALGPLGPDSYTGALGPRMAIPEARRAEALDGYGKGLAEARWNVERDGKDHAVRFDYAVALGRMAAAYPEGDRKAVTQLEESLGLLRQLEQSHAGATRRFQLEFTGSLAERRRQIGDWEGAVGAWRSAAAIARRWMEAETTFPPRRLMIPIYVNWALETARRKDPAGALALARQAEQLAEEVEGMQKQYARAAGWRARARGWVAGVYDVVGDRAAAEAARKESVELWKAVMARTDVPADVRDEARRATGQ